MDLLKIDILQNDLVNLVLKIMSTRDKYLSDGKPDDMFKSITECKNKARKIVNNIYDAFGYSEFDPIFEKICDVAGVSREEMIANKNNRAPEYCIPRQIHTVLLHLAYGLSQSEAGLKYYGKDHSTINHSIKTVNNLIDTDSEFREKYRPVFEQAINDSKIRKIKITKLHIDYAIPKDENTK